MISLFRPATTLASAAAIVLVAGCANRSDDAVDTQPRVFAAETISVGNVYRGTFASGDESFYFFKKVTEDEEDYRIFVSRNVDGAWTEPERVSLGGEYSDLYPSISRDGRRLVFSSYRPIQTESDSSVAANANLWYAERIAETSTGGDANKGAGSWGEPVFIAAASTPANYDAKPFFGPDGSIYFESISPDWRTRHSLITRWDGERNAYTEPQPFEDVERWRTWREDLYIWGGVPGPDGSFVVLDVSSRDAETGRTGTSDQWITMKSEDGNWSEPQPLGGGLNSDGYDNFTFFAADGESLFFVRDFEQFYRVPLEGVLAQFR